MLCGKKISISFLNKTHPLLTVTIARKLLKKVTNLLHQYYLDLGNKENCFVIQFSVYVDNFEQYFDSSLLTIQNDLHCFL